MCVSCVVDRELVDEHSKSAAHYNSNEYFPDKDYSM